MAVGDAIYAYVTIKNGEEVVIAVEMEGHLLPLMSIDEKLALGSMREKAELVARTYKLEVKLLKFTHREEIETIPSKTLKA